MHVGRVIDKPAHRGPPVHRSRPDTEYVLLEPDITCNKASLTNIDKPP